MSFCSFTLQNKNMYWFTVDVILSFALQNQSEWLSIITVEIYCSLSLFLQCMAGLWTLLFLVLTKYLVSLKGCLLLPILLFSLHWMMRRHRLLLHTGADLGVNPLPSQDHPR